MIIANIIGGLGNQMFQFASAEAMGAATGQPVRYVIDLFEQQNTHNGFELERVFGLTVPTASTADLASLIGQIRAHPTSRRALAKFNAPQWLCGRHFRIEHGFSFDPDLAGRLRSGGYMHGYWQSERYFAPVADQLRAAFTFRAVEHLALPAPAEINVSLHVRRGDYLAEGSVHAPCDANYYERALRKLDLPIKQTALFIFSDDPTWARTTLFRLHPNLHIIEGHKGKDSYKDMYLMSRCDHHIIANSSFSWWGAWLNSSSKKRVIAPRRWFSDSLLDDCNIIPSEWERI